ncbi:MAG: hypothetical protein Q9210_003438 [Variospora velana]
MDHEDLYNLETDGSPASTLGRSKLTLRDLPSSARLFWEDSQSKQHNLVVLDKDLWGREYSMHKNAVAAMALNEYAAEAGQGFSYLVRSRQAWFKGSDLYACNKTYPVYVTEQKSLVIYATSKTFYIGTSTDMEKAIDRWCIKGYKPSGPRAERRLNTTPFLWND